MKLNSHAKELIVNITFTLEELEHLQNYIEYLKTYPDNVFGFNTDLLNLYATQLKSIIQEVERNA